MPEPLWRGETWAYQQPGEWSWVPDEDLPAPPGTEVVVLTAGHYDDLMDVAQTLALRLIRNAIVVRGVTTLAEVIAELGLTQEEIDGA